MSAMPTVLVVGDKQDEHCTTSDILRRAGYRVESMQAMQSGGIDSLPRPIDRLRVTEQVRQGARRNGRGKTSPTNGKNREKKPA